MRIYAFGGGCHEYQDEMAVESKVEEGDTVIEKSDLKIILDSQRAPLRKGTEVHDVDSVQGSGSAMKNPQAKNTCGCGRSFTV